MSVRSNIRPKHSTGCINAVANALHIPLSITLNTTLNTTQSITHNTVLGDPQSHSLRGGLQCAQAQLGQCTPADLIGQLHSSMNVLHGHTLEALDQLAERQGAAFKNTLSPPRDAPFEKTLSPARDAAFEKASSAAPRANQHPPVEDPDVSAEPRRDGTVSPASANVGAPEVPMAVLPGPKTLTSAQAAPQVCVHTNMLPPNNPY